MAIIDEPRPKNAATKELLDKSEQRYYDASADSLAFDLSSLFLEARALLELGSMENDTLKKLRRLALAQFNYEELVYTLEALLKQAKEAGANIGAKMIPALMDEVGIDHYGLTPSTEVKLESKVYASLKKENNAKGIEWLEANGASAIVKRTLTIPFTTRQGALAEKVAKAVTEALGPDAVTTPVEDARTVHPQTLAAYVRTELREGRDVPFDLLGVHHSRVAKIVEK